jgi:hypothetical protein
MSNRIALEPAAVGAGLPFELLSRPTPTEGIGHIPPKERYQIAFPATIRQSLFLLYYTYYSWVVGAIQWIQPKPKLHALEPTRSGSVGRSFVCFKESNARCPLTRNISTVGCAKIVPKSERPRISCPTGSESAEPFSLWPCCWISWYSPWS